MRILVIEDEQKTAAFLAKGLREAGFVVDVAPDGEAGLSATRASKFDLLIVDIMLPKKMAGLSSKNCARPRCRRRSFF
jgi:two-component system copper resistance phosphate regulon response regulator CusR